MGSHRLIYFRTDGNSQIATGHLMRCLSIAQACQVLSLPVCFLASDEDSASLLKQFDPAGTFPVRILSSAVYNDMEKELPELLSLLSEAPSLLFVDSYFVTEPYLQAVSGICPVAYLDDLQLFDYPVDLVINYDIIPEDMLPSYQAAYKRAGQTLLGASYTPLRSQFQMEVPAVRPSVKDILITTGGSDPYHFCLKLLSCFQERLSALIAEPDFHLHVLIGKRLLLELAEELPFLKLHENVTDMAALMASCDLAISAAGTTLYELCAVGIPAVSYSFADNQLPSSLAFANVGAVPYAGDLRMDTESCSIVPSPDSKGTGSAYGLPGVLSAVCHFVTDMSGNMAKRKSAQQSMRRLIDGKGSCRIARALEECAFHNFRSP